MEREDLVTSITRARRWVKSWIQTSPCESWSSYVGEDGVGDPGRRSIATAPQPSTRRTRGEVTVERGHKYYETRCMNPVPECNNFDRNYERAANSKRRIHLLECANVYIGLELKWDELKQSLWPRASGNDYNRCVEPNLCASRFWLVCWCQEQGNSRCSEGGVGSTVSNELPSVRMCYSSTSPGTAFHLSIRVWKPVMYDQKRTDFDANSISLEETPRLHILNPCHHVQRGFHGCGWVRRCRVIGWKSWWHV